MGDNSVQYCFRLSLSNPDHLFLHQILSDLDLDIHRSKSAFIINGLISYVRNNGQVNTNTYKSKLVTLDDLEVMKGRLKQEIREDVIRETLKEVLGIVLSGQGRVIVSKSEEADEKADKEAMNVLHELTDKWS